MGSTNLSITNIRLKYVTIDLWLGYGYISKTTGGKGVTSAWSPLGNFLEGQAHPNLSSNQVFLFFLREVFCVCFPVSLRLLCLFSNSF